MSPPTRLTLTHHLAATLIDEAVAAGAHEICGILGGDARQRLRRYPVTNQATRPADRFAMDPVGQIAVFKTLREQALTLVAIYHSHPVGEAVPSAHDRAGHSYPRALAIIVAPGAACAHRRIRAWEMAENRLPEEVPVTIDDPFL